MCDTEVTTDSWWNQMSPEDAVLGNCKASLLVCRDAAGAVSITVPKILFLLVTKQRALHQTWRVAASTHHSHKTPNSNLDSSVCKTWEIFLCFVSFIAPESSRANTQLKFLLEMLWRGESWQAVTKHVACFSSKDCGPRFNSAICIWPCAYSLITLKLSFSSLYQVSLQDLHEAQILVMGSLYYSPVQNVKFYCLDIRGHILTKIIAFNTKLAT